MESEKIFWGLIAVVFVGLAFAFVFATAVNPINASSAGQKAVQQQGANTYYAPLAAGTQVAAPSAQQAQGAATQGGQLAAVNNGVQEVQLSVSGSNYMPNPIRVKVGVPVRLVADIANMPGCSKSVVIPDFEVRKTVSAGDNVIEFTPTQSGTFSFSCSMNMYKGTIIVEEADGTVAAFAGAAPAPSAIGGCHMGAGGGCGCGG